MTYYGYSGKTWALIVSIGILLVSMVFNCRDVYQALRQVISSARGKKKE